MASQAASLPILIVEDEPATRAELCRALEEELAAPQFQVQTAGSVEEGLGLVEAAAASGDPFRVALLDFRVPAKPGGHPEGDAGLCALISGKSPGTQVLHMTAYSQDRSLLEHVRQRPGSGGHCLGLIDKNDPLWIEATIDRLSTFLSQGSARQEPHPEGHGDSSVGSFSSEGQVHQTQEVRP